MSGGNENSKLIVLVRSELLISLYPDSSKLFQMKQTLTLVFSVILITVYGQNINDSNDSYQPQVIKFKSTDELIKDKIASDFEEAHLKSLRYGGNIKNASITISILGNTVNGFLQSSSQMSDKSLGNNIALVSNISAGVLNILGNAYISRAGKMKKHLQDN